MIFFLLVVFYAHSDFLPLRPFMRIVVIFIIFRFFDVLTSFVFYAFYAFYSFCAFYAFYACEITPNNLIYYTTCFYALCILYTFCAYKKYLSKSRLFNVSMLFMCVKYFCKKKKV